VQVPFDVMKNMHVDRENKLFNDFMMFVDIESERAYLQSHGFVFLKLIKNKQDDQATINTVYLSNDEKSTDSKLVQFDYTGQSLSLLSQINDDYLVFQYENKQ
jgi:hypothetical protein